MENRLDPKLNSYYKKRSFVTSFIDIDPFLWVPNCDYKDGYFYVQDNGLLPETKGVSRQKSWILSNDGLKQAIFAQNFEHYENILSLIYCAIADHAKIPCMSSVPAKKVDKSGENEVEGLLSLNVCGGNASLIGADEIANKGSTIKSLALACEKYVQTQTSMFLDREFKTDLAKLVMLDYLTVGGDKSTFANYNLASVGVGQDQMLCVAPATDNGLCFGLRSKSFWLVRKPERIMDRVAQISKGEIEESQNAFFKEFGSVLPIMPYSETSLDNAKDREQEFLKQMSIMILEDNELLQTFDCLTSINFNEVKGVMQTRHKGLIVGENVYSICETLFNHRIKSLASSLNHFRSLKENEPDEYFKLVDEFQVSDEQELMR